MKNVKVTIKNNPESPVAPEIIAEAVIEISKAMTKLRNTRLTDEALYLLIQNNCQPCGQHKYGKTKPTIKQIKSVMNSIDTLEKVYVKKSKTK